MKITAQAEVEHRLQGNRRDPVVAVPVDDVGKHALRDELPDAGQQVLGIARRLTRHPRDDNRAGPAERRKCPEFATKPGSPARSLSESTS
jgi:hypothetical protein